ncbi:MAG: tRNA pseudouridine(65) synthase TruC [Fuerstiella sp.]|nr:tRNA pseudouridine(65) synthase TruC [Fuerstiella sp.]MCP4854910.1 tRNA pseudouridine(65) synthase TruC [Fuerstiella sp.]
MQILYQDEHLVAVAKPSGMFVHRSDADRSVESVVVQTLRDQLKQHVYPVHRLDRATSGLLLLARSRSAAAASGHMFSERRVQKTYSALVRGYALPQGQIDTPLISSRGREKPASHPWAEPQHAMTGYRTLQQFEIPIALGEHTTTRCSLVEVHPETGRYHQIRRHFNYVSHPVIGDTSHGDGRHNRLYRDHFEAERLMLAAVRLEFRHPVTGTPCDIRCPPEPSFTTVMGQLDSFRVLTSAV